MSDEKRCPKCWRLMKPHEKLVKRGGQHICHKCVNELMKGVR